MQETVRHAQDIPMTEFHSVTFFLTSCVPYLIKIQLSSKMTRFIVSGIEAKLSSSPCFKPRAFK